MIETGFFRTNRFGTGKGAHHHILFINTDRNVAECSEGNNHVHEVVWHAPVPEQPGQPAQPPQFDQMGNMVSPGSPEIPPQPAQPGYWEVLPGGKDGHAHEIEPYSNFVGRKEEEKPEEQKLKEAIQKYRAARQNERDAREKGYESEEFYDGKQWDDTEKKKLEDAGRAAITDNEIGPAIDNLRSFEIEQRADYKFRPTEGGDQRTCELLDLIVKNVTDQNEYHVEQSEVFLDTAVVGKGVYGITWDKSRGVSGDIEIGRREWDEVHFGPHKKLDASDAQVCAAEKWMTKDEVKAFWGDKAEKIDEKWQLVDDVITDEKKFHKHTTNAYDYGKSVLDTLGPDLIDVDKRQVNVVELWEKVWREETVATVESAEYALNVWSWDKADIEALKTMPSVKALTKPVCRAKVTTFAGPVLLEEENPADIPPIAGKTDYFPFTVMYCYKRGNKYWGKVEWNKDAQRQSNKRKSQAIDIGNRMAAYAWLSDSETFANDDQKERFRRNISTPGALLEVANVNRPPTKLEGVKFPSELVQLMQLDQAEIQRRLNVIASPTGANQSGANLMQQQAMKLAGNEFLFDSLRRAFKRNGKLILAYIQHYYTPLQIYRLVKDSSAEGQGQPGQLKPAAFTEDEIEHILNTQDLTKYDVAIGSIAFTSTVRLAVSMMLGDMIKAGVPIPPKASIEINDAIPRHIKEQVYQMMDQQAKAQQAEAEAKMKMELGKTLIAHQPPQQQPEQQQPQGPAPMSAPEPSKRAVDVNVNVNVNNKSNADLQEPDPAELEAAGAMAAEMG